VLDERGVDDNTLLIVTSDNGAHWTPADQRQYDHRANGPWRGMKADLFEGGHRIPFLARWPDRIPAGTESDTVIGLQDVFATVAEVCKLKIPAGAGEDSVSFHRVLYGRKPSKRPPLIHHSINGSFAIRDGFWKLLLAPDSGGWTSPRPGTAETQGLPEVQLYHLQHDPAETGNLAATRPEIVSRLTADLERLVQSGRSTPGPPATNDVPIRLRKITPRATGNP
jgi:arylsulfatase A-like enzyme